MKLNKKQMKRPLILSYLIVVGLSIIISMQMTSQVNYLIKLGYSKNESKKLVKLTNFTNIAQKQEKILKQEKDAALLLATDYIGVIPEGETTIPLKSEVNKIKSANENSEKALMAKLQPFIDKGYVLKKDESLKKQLSRLNGEVLSDTVSISENNKNEVSVIDGVTYVDGLVIVNKYYAIPDNYATAENPEALGKLMELIGAMQRENLNVSNEYSGYRSFAYQETLYNGYLAEYGQAETDRFSARPGYCEHQTGLAFDLINKEGILLGQNDSNQNEVAWLKANAAKYGFIIRYPEGKEASTGYMYESWHLRYVGDKASAIANSGLSLEEYYNLETGN